MDSKIQEEQAASTEASASTTESTSSSAPPQAIHSSDNSQLLIQYLQLQLPKTEASTTSPDSSPISSGNFFHVFPRYPMSANYMSSFINLSETVKTVKAIIRTKVPKQIIAIASGSGSPMTLQQIMLTMYKNAPKEPEEPSTSAASSEDTLGAPQQEVASDSKIIPVAQQRQMSTSEESSSSTGSTSSSCSRVTLNPLEKYMDSVYNIMQGDPLGKVPSTKSPVKVIGICTMNARKEARSRIIERLKQRNLSQAFEGEDKKENEEEDDEEDEEDDEEDEEDDDEKEEDEDEGDEGERKAKMAKIAKNDESN